MSDIAKKTLPPGSWPGKGAKTGEETTSEAGPRSAPRSVDAPPSMPKEGEEPGEEVHSPGTHYTHQKDTPLDDIQEESIKMSDREGGDTSDLKHVEPTPMSNGIGPEDDMTEVSGQIPESQAEETGEHLQEQAEGEHELQHEQPGEVGEEEAQEELQKAREAEVPAEEYGGEEAKTTLTDRAKQAFSYASKNQPTSEARDQFFKAASSLTGSKKPAEGEEAVPEGVEEGTVVPEDSVTSHGGPAGAEVEGLEGSQAEQLQVPASEAAEDVVPDLSVLKNGTVNKGGNVVDADGKVVGRVVEGALKDVAGKKVDENGDIWTDSGKKLGRAEPISDNERNEMMKEPTPFESFPDAVVDGNGMVVSGGETIGKVTEGDIKVLRGKSVDADGDILDKSGNVIGKAERWEPEEEPEPEPEAEADRSALAGGKVNKAGNVVDNNGHVVGHIVEGVLKHLIGKKVDANGDIWSDDGKVIGRAEVLPENERDELAKVAAPFESFPDAVVDGDGMVVSNGETIGKVIEGDVKVLRGKSVDADGDILDKSGNVIGKAERWEAEKEPEPEAIDRSILAGKRVNKAGNVVDSSGTIYGRVVEGDVKAMVGRMCDKQGNILSESGDIIGRADIVSEGEREGLKEGPFAELSGCTVAKDGTVVTPSGDIVGRLISGDGKVLFGRAVDEDGDVLDRNGNVLGKAERWEPEEVEKSKNPMSGRRVNREGNVVDADGNIIGKLTSGNLQVCSGKEIDDDGDVVDGKGTVIGHVSLLEDIPEVGESEDDKSKREKAEVDKKLAIQMTVCIEQCLDKIRPICKMITEKIDHAERQPEEERDEEQLVRDVRPLIEEGGRILTEAKGIIKGLDPDGRISANAKHKTASREATPEEYRLADVLKDLTGEVTECIENAKKKIEGMPHAKKELNPLWGLLNEPLFQILAAVGLLLNGVLSLVGRLLSGLGLGGLLDGLLGTLGLNRVLEGLGLGSVTKSLTGGDKKKKSGGGGLLGGVLGGGGK